MAAALTVAGAGSLLEIPPVEWAIVIINIGLVLALETINTALEGYVDLAAPGRRDAAARAKDAAAGAVLIAAISSVVVAGVIFGPRLGELWSALGRAFGRAPLLFAAYVLVTLILLASGVLRRDKWPT